ncbi:MAG: type II toxin-antitoxin system RelE/ParE family toxin [Ferruginibacter sp.]
MVKYVLSNKAVDDLSNIWNYTYEIWSENLADKYYFQLLDYCQDLSENPLLGKHYEEIYIELFGFKPNHHIIFYRKLKGTRIEIVRILHGQMDLKNRIQE